MGKEPQNPLDGGKNLLIRTPVNIDTNSNPHSFLEEINPNANHFAANIVF
jgi:hypothetical protein